MPFKSSVPAMHSRGNLHYAAGTWVGVPTAKEVAAACALVGKSPTAPCARGVAALYARSPKGTNPFIKPKNPMAASIPGTLRWDPPAQAQVAKVAKAKKPAAKAKKPAARAKKGLKGFGEVETMKPDIGPVAGFLLFGLVVAGGWWLTSRA